MAASSTSIFNLVTVDANSEPLKKKPDRLPWPRKSEDDLAELGIDVIAKEMDIRKIIGKWFFVKDYPMEDLMQEVFVTIIHKNTTRSAHDPRKSSFGHYVWMIGNHVCINIVNKKKRYDKESDSIDTPRWSDDSRTLLDTYEDSDAVMPDEDITSDITGVQKMLWKSGKLEAARYISAVKTGAPSYVIKEALSFRKSVTNKDIRYIRSEIESIFRTTKDIIPIFNFAHLLLSCFEEQHVETSSWRSQTDIQPTLQVESQEFYHAV